MNTKSVAKIAISVNKNISLISEAFDMAIAENDQLKILAEKHIQTISDQDDKIKKLQMEIKIGEQ